MCSKASDAMKVLHPKMAAHGAKVAAAHKFLAAKVPGFKAMPAKQRMQTVQAHVRRMK